MTSIATNNGAIVLKNGSIGTDCVCCGDGWYCYDGAAAGKCYCVCEDPSKMLPNILLFSCQAQSWSPPPGHPNQPNPATSGNVTLTRPTSCSALSWSGQYVSGGVTITVEVVANNVSTNGSAFGEGVSLLWGTPSYANTFITSTGSFSASHGKDALQDICNGTPMPSYQAGATYTASVVRGD